MSLSRWWPKRLRCPWCGRLYLPRRCTWKAHVKWIGREWSTLNCQRWSQVVRP